MSLSRLVFRTVIRLYRFLIVAFLSTLDKKVHLQFLYKLPIFSDYTYGAKLDDAESLTFFSGGFDNLCDAYFFSLSIRHWKFI